MNLNEAETLAKSLMTQHGVGYLAFAFDGGKRRMGATFFLNIGGSKLPTKITLSRHYAALLSEQEVRDIILHEIAHALAGHAAGHGPVWRNAARKIGAKAERCGVASASPEHSVLGTCPVCDKVVSRQHRLPLRVYFHSKCGKHSVLTWTRKGVSISLEQMPERYRLEYRRSYA